MSKKRILLLVAFPIAAVVLALAGVARADTSAGPVSRTVYGCDPAIHAGFTPMSSPSRSCPAGTTSVSIGGTGATGPAGKAGPSGVQAIASHDFVDPTAALAVVTGGSFVSLSTQAGSTYDLAAGTYEACLSGKAEQPVAASGSVSAQLFLYDQAKSSNYTGDLLNVSADTQGGTSHDAYLNGCTIVTESSPVTLRLYAFGYDSDQGSGTYNLISATLHLVQLTPAG
jgi:hypothetical protein